MNLEKIEEIIAVLDEYPIMEIRMEQAGAHVTVRKGAASLARYNARLEEAARQQQSAERREEDAAAAAPVADTSITVAAPMVGLFHHANPPIRYGTVLTAGQVVGQIESMKLMNEVTAEAGGRVVEIATEDGAPVEYGQPLFRLA